jgi:hypothetical protein
VLLPEELREARRQRDAAARPARAVGPAQRAVRRMLVARVLPPAEPVAALDARAVQPPGRQVQRAAARQARRDAAAQPLEPRDAVAQPALPVSPREAETEARQDAAARPRDASAG